MKSILTFGLVVFCFHLSAQHFPSATKVERVMDNAVKKTGIPSVVAIAINKNGEEISFTFGPAVWSESKPVTTENIFRIYSMTKLVTSIAAMQLVERGQLTLDGDLSPLLPDMEKIPILKDGQLQKATNSITLRHLLSHTSGFGYSATDAELSKFDRSKWEYRDLPRRFEPGTAFLYGTSTDWVGRLVEKVSGLSLEEYFAKNIFKPLKMSRTFFVVPDSLKTLIVSFGTHGDDGKHPLKELPDRMPTRVPTEFSGGGGLFSTPADYTKLLRALLNEGEYDGIRIIQKSTLQEMLKPQTGAISMDISRNYYNPGTCCNFNGLIFPESKWGLAWLLDGTDEPSGPKAGTASWGGLLNSYFFIDFKSGIAASIYAQYFPFNDPQVTGLFTVFKREIYGAK